MADIPEKLITLKPESLKTDLDFTVLFSTEDIPEKLKFQFMDVPEKLKFHFMDVPETLFFVLVASIVSYYSSVVTVFSYFRPLVVYIGLFFAAVIIFGRISPPKTDWPAKKPEQSSSTRPQAIHKLTGAQGEVQGNFSAGAKGNLNSRLQGKKDSLKDNQDSPQNNKDSPHDKKGNIQLGGSGHNPQVLGTISVGGESNLNFGLQYNKDSPQDNKDKPQDKRDSPQDNKYNPQDYKDNKGNIQIGGSGHNPQVLGTISVGGESNLNFGLQYNKDGPQDNKDKPQDKNDSPQDNKYNPQDYKDNKGNIQIGGTGHNPQMQGSIIAGAKCNINF